jgi:hypothetical protein
MTKAQNQFISGELFQKISLFVLFKGQMANLTNRNWAFFEGSI